MYCYPFLNTGVMWADFQSFGAMPDFMEALLIRVSDGAISGVTSLRPRGLISSGPLAFVGFSCFRSFSILLTLAVMLMSSHMG